MSLIKFKDFTPLNENQVFTHTIYRIPTVEELEAFTKTELDSKAIYEEICYTIIGRGIASHENKSKILMTAKKLVESFPEDKRFPDVLKLADEFFHKNRETTKYESN